MAKPKEKRNKLFLEDWQKGFSNQSLAEKYKLSIGGVKALKGRIRAKQTGQVKPKEKKEPSLKVTSTSTSTKRMTFWLPEDVIKAIKKRAKKEGVTASEILRQLLGKNL